MSLKTLGGDYASGGLEAFLNLKKQRDPFPAQLDSRERTDYETGTDALAAIGISSKAQRIWIPLHFCEETLKIFDLKVRSLTNALEFHRYREISELKKTCLGDLVLFVHFNRYQEKELIEVREIQKASRFILVEDFTHAPTEISRMQGDYAFNSLRKILPLEISIAYGKSLPSGKKGPSVYYEKKKKAADAKRAFLREGIGSESEFLKFLSEAEVAHAGPNLYRAQPAEAEGLARLDLNQIWEHRRMNLRHLKKRIADVVEILPHDGMFLMITTPQRDALRNHLRKHNIFAPVHWLDSASPQRETLLSLPIDQRYQISDMDRIAETVIEFFKDLN